MSDLSVCVLSTIDQTFQDAFEKPARQIKLCMTPRLSGVEVNQEQQFMVDTKGAGGQGQLQVAVVSFFPHFVLFLLSMSFDFACDYNG